MSILMKNLNSCMVLRNRFDDILLTCALKLNVESVAVPMINSLCPIVRSLSSAFSFG